MIILKEEDLGLDSYGLKLRKMSDCCEHVSDLCVSINAGVSLDQTMNS
jgi:hypothetical protein